jgi:hypothetical protein
MTRSLHSRPARSRTWWSRTLAYTSSRSRRCAKHELAEKLYLDRKSAQLAEQAAQHALGEVKAGKSADNLNAELLAHGAGSADGEADPLAPQFRDTQPFGRTDTPIAGPFDGSPLVKAAFELTEQKPLPEAPMKLGDEWVVYKLEARVFAKREDLTEKDEQRIRNGLLNQKRRDVLTDYVRTLLRKAEDDKAVFVDESVLRANVTEDNT